MNFRNERLESELMRTIDGCHCMIDINVSNGCEESGYQGMYQTAPSQQKVDVLCTVTIGAIRPVVYGSEANNTFCY